MDTDHEQEIEYKQRGNYVPAEEFAEKLYRAYLSSRTEENWLRPNLLLHIREAEISCPYCDEMFRFQLTNKHIKVHLKEIYPNCKENQKIGWFRNRFYQSAAEPIWEIICRLYNVTLQGIYTSFDMDNDYLIQRESGYSTATPRLNRKGERGGSHRLSLRNGDIHLTGWTRSAGESKPRRECYGIVPRLRTTFAALDVDIYDIETCSKAHVDIGVKYYRAALEILQGIDLRPHLIYSGNKGFHIVMYFDEPIPNQYAIRLLQWVKSQLPQQEGVYVEIEIRPEGEKTTRGIRLPLGYNAETGNGMVFLDKDGEPFYDQYSHLFRIEENRNKTADVLGKIKTLPEIKPTVPKSIDVDETTTDETSAPKTSLAIPKSIETDTPTPRPLITDVSDLPGLCKHGTRHDTAFINALRLRNQGITGEEKLFTALVEWSQRDGVKQFTQSSWNEVVQDCKDIAKSVLKKKADGSYQYNLKEEETTKRSFTHLFYNQDDAEYLNSLDIGNLEKTILCYSIGIIRGRGYYEDGYVYLSNKQLNRLSGAGSKNTRLLKKINRALNALNDKGLMELVEKGGRDKKGKLTTTKYQVKCELPSDEGDKILSIKHRPNSKLNQYLWQTVYGGRERFV